MIFSFRHYILLSMFCGLFSSTIYAQILADTVLANQYVALADSLFDVSEQNEDIIKYYTEAANLYKRSESWNDYLQCQMNISTAILSNGLFAKSTSLLRESLELCRNRLGENTREEAEILLNLGVSYGMRGYHDLELECYANSLEIQKRRADKILIAKTYGNMAIAHTSIGNLNSALEYSKKALTIIKNRPGKRHILLLKAYVSMINIYTSRGEYNLATDYSNQAIILLRKYLDNDESIAGSVYTNVSTPYMSLGQNSVAINFLEKALTIRKKQDDKARMAIIYSNMGQCYFNEKDYKSALFYFNKALQIKKVVYHENSNKLVGALDGLADTYLKLGNYDSATFFYEAAIKASGDGYSRASAYQNIAKVKERLSLDSALLYYQKAIEANFVDPKTISNFNYPPIDSKNIRDPLLLLETLSMNANLLWKMYLSQNRYVDLKEAIRHYELCDTLIRNMWEEVSMQKDEILLSKTARNVYENGIELHKRIFLNTNNTTFLEKAFYYFERSKENTLLKAISSAEAMTYSDIPDSLVQEEKSLKVDRSFYQSQLQNTASSAREEVDTIKYYYQNKLIFANRRYDSLVSTLENKFSNYYQLKYMTRTATVPSIQSQLSSSEAVISYFIGDSIQYAFTITKNQYQVTPLPLNTLLEQHIQSLRRVLRPDSTSQAEYVLQASTLYQQLLAPIIEDSLLVGINQLTIIPDGALGYLPFDLLLTQPVAADADYRTLPYLMRDYTIRYGYSATWLFHPFSRPERPVQDQYIAFAPSYQSGTSDSTQQLALGRFRDQVAPLRFNQREATNIHEYLSGVSLTDQSAVERRFKEEAGQYSVIHLAMHALVDDENPMYSRLVFSPDAADTVEDGYLNAYELYNMELPADLAVLSACETGYGKLEQGEGIMSLARAFAYAGCPSIVMSHWAVDDAASAQLMDYFYRYLSEGLPKDEALRQAKLDYLATAPAQSTAPFFWGNFVLIGDASPIVTPRSAWWYWLLGGGGLLVVGLVVFLVRSRVQTKPSFRNFL